MQFLYQLHFSILRRDWCFDSCGPRLEFSIEVSVTWSCLMPIPCHPALTGGGWRGRRYWVMPGVAPCVNIAWEGKQSFIFCVRRLRIAFGPSLFWHIPWLCLHPDLARSTSEVWCIISPRLCWVGTNLEPSMQAAAFGNNSFCTWCCGERWRGRTLCEQWL